VRRRVVVTGLGAVTPLGADVETTWTRLVAGTNAVVAPRRYGPGGVSPTKAVGEIDEEVVQRLREEHEDAAGFDLRTLFGVAAAREAIAAAGIRRGPHPRAGIAMGSGPGVHWIDDVGVDATRGGASHPESLVHCAAEQPAVLVATEWGLGGPLLAPTTACSASNQAIGAAFRAVRSGRADWMVAGGADSMVNPTGLVFFVLLGASADAGDDPASACRPFDRARTGLVMGEGAGCAILEAEEHARARGAKVLAEVVGYGSSFDAFRPTAPHPEGRGAAEAMSRALADGGLSPADVDWVNAHGTGTKRNDPAEARAVRAVFGARAAKVAVSSGKSMMGHLLSGAAGAAFTASVLACERDVVPPTTNLTDPDPDCTLADGAFPGLDFVAGAARRGPVRAVLNSAFAFGGQNSVVAVRKWRGEGAR
jgi:3-oxoacyl-[acyl-carrier-protein] synthase II